MRLALALLLPLAAAAAEPTAEDFKRALDGHFLAASGGFLPRPCVHVGFYLGAPEVSFAGTEFDWTPASFLARHDASSPKVGNPEDRYQYLVKQGFMQVRTAADGAREYTMTWKGFGATDGQGCFFTGGGRIEPVVLSFEKAGSRWRVTASGRPTEIEPWASGPEFPAIFGNYGESRSEFFKKTYEIERAGGGYAVVVRQDPAMKNTAIRAWQQERERKRLDPAKVAAQVGPLTAGRILGMLREYAEQAYAPLREVCFALPHMVDEQNFEAFYRTPEGQARPVPAMTIYNLEWRPGGPGDQMRHYDILSRLESTGLATGKRVAASEYRGVKADGALRFELTPAGVAMLAPPPSVVPCLVAGHVEVEEVVGLQQFDAATLRPKFAARTRFVPLPGREALLARFGHFARLQEVGGALVGQVTFDNGRVAAEHVVYKNPRYRLERDRLKPLPFN